MAHKTHILNRLLPMSFRTALRRAALSAIPSMRHLDMPKRLRHMRTLGFMPRNIVDVGAGHGDWARMAGAIWPDARIFGFEPNQSEHAALEEAKRQLPHFEYRHAFLGSQKGHFAYNAAGHGTSLLAPGTHALAQGERATASECVPMLVLDDLIAAGEVPAPQLLKLDVQGYELQVLAGAPNALRQCEAVLAEVNFFEFHAGVPLAQEVIAFMKDHDFEWYDVMGILRRPLDDAVGQMDLMFVRANHPLRRSNGW